MASRWLSRPPIQVALQKRRDALRSIKIRQRAITALKARVVALDAEIAALGGSKRPPQGRALARVKPGDNQRLLFAIIRKHGSVTSAELADAMRVQIGGDAQDHLGRSVLRHRALQVISRCAAVGLLCQVGGYGRFKRWALSMQKAAHPS